MSTNSTRDEFGRWPKGVSGNPAGPAPGHIKLTARLRKQLEQPAASDKEYAEIAAGYGLDPAEVTIGDLVIRSWIGSALGGAHPPIATIFDRLDGKVADKLELEGGPRVLQIALEEATRPTSHTAGRETPGGVSDGKEPEAPDPSE
jgi:hypothetical protein